MVYPPVDRLPTYPILPSVKAPATPRFTRRHARILARWTALFLILNIADGVLTWFGLQQGIPERLPVYAWLFAHTSYAVAMLFKAFVDVWAVAFVVATRRKWPWPGFAALCMRLLCLETLLVVAFNAAALYVRVHG